MEPTTGGTIGAALALALLAGPLAAPAGASCSREGDPAFYIGFGDDRTVIAGVTVVLTVAPANFAMVSSCAEADTFCLHVRDSRGWAITGDPPLGGCQRLDIGYLWYQDISITAPCGAATGELDTVFAVIAYCGGRECDTDCLDLPGCEDPNVLGGEFFYSADTIVLEVVSSPPRVIVLCDTLALAAFQQSANHIPFSVCNGDPCDSTETYDYEFSNGGLIPWNDAYPRTGSVTAAGGECVEVYAVLDANLSEVCDFDTVTLVAWDRATGTTRDTGMTLIHVIPVMPVPFLSLPFIAILAAAVLAAGTLFLKRAARRGNA